MKKNERLIGIRPYQTSTGDWHLELTYAYEDKKGEHRVIFPDVQCPFPTHIIPVPTQAILFPDTTPHAVGIHLRSCGCSIRGLERIQLNMGSCQLAQERGTTEPAYAFDIVTNYFTRDMTIEEIEKELGYKVKIVSKEEKK